MIIDNINNLKLYENVNPNIKFVVDYVYNNNLFNISNGKHIINDKVFFVKDEYIANNLENCVFESHKNYIDIQLVLKGKEYFGYAYENEEKEIIQNYDKNNDIEKYKLNEYSKVLLKDNIFALVLPQDLHMPKIKFDSNKIQKIVFKVKI